MTNQPLHIIRKWIADGHFNDIQATSTDLSYDGVVLPLDLDTEFHPKIQTKVSTYTVGQIWMVLQHKDSAYTDYFADCKKNGLQNVLFIDKKPITDWLFGLKQSIEGIADDVEEPTKPAETQQPSTNSKASEEQKIENRPAAHMAFSFNFGSNNQNPRPTTTQPSQPTQQPTVQQPMVQQPANPMMMNPMMQQPMMNPMMQQPMMNPMMMNPMMMNPMMMNPMMQQPMMNPMMMNPMMQQPMMNPMMMNPMMQQPMMMNPMMQPQEIYSAIFGFYPTMWQIMSK